jgi:hypothetical protein
MWLAVVKTSFSLESYLRSVIWVSRSDIRFFCELMTLFLRKIPGMKKNMVTSAPARSVNSKITAMLVPGSSQKKSLIETKSEFCMAKTTAPIARMSPMISCRIVSVTDG